VDEVGLVLLDFDVVDRSVVAEDTGVLELGDAAKLAMNGQKKVRLTIFVGDGTRPSKDATVIVHLPSTWNLCGDGKSAAVPRAQVPAYLSQGYTVGNCAP
jgi:hypothetical protein